MLIFQNAFRFIRKNIFQSLIVLFAVFVSVGVQFFIFSLGSVLDHMVLEQVTSYQDHIVVKDIYSQKVLYEDLDFSLKQAIKDNDDNILFVNYFLQINGHIIKKDDAFLSPSIRLDLYGYDDFNENGDYLTYTGLDLNKHLTHNSKVADPNKAEIMLDIEYARQNDFEIGQTITYELAANLERYDFLIVGFYDLGIMRIKNDYTYLNLEHFQNLSSNNFMIKLQLKKTAKTDESLEKVSTFFVNENYKYVTWKEVIPELNILSQAQKIVVFMIELFISVIFFIVILSVLNFSTQQKLNQLGILKAIGQSKKDVEKTLLLQTVIIALIGIVLGLAAGFGAIRIFSSTMTYPDGSPRFFVNFQFKNFFIPGILSLLSAVAASIISFLKIRKRTITELLKL